MFEEEEQTKTESVEGNRLYNSLRKSLLETCCKINSVANPEGNGRDDLTLDILIAAEDIIKKSTSLESKATIKLAEKIKKSFIDMRSIIKKYSTALDFVDPQLRNNKDLVEVLANFEKSWEKGKEFLLNSDSSNMLRHFSHLIEETSERHKELREKITAADTDVFVIIPCLLVLSSLKGEDAGICRAYYFAISEDTSSESQQYQNTLRNFVRIKKKEKYVAEFNSFLEQQLILDKEEIRKDKRLNADIAEIKQLLHDVKIIAIGLQRSKPLEWNSLMEVTMGQQ